MCFIVDIYWKSFIGTSDRFNSRICAGSRAYNCQKDTEISADTRCRNQMVIRNVHRIRYLTDTVSYGMSHTVQVATRGSNFWSSKVCEGGSHMKHTHADSLLIHPNFSSKLMIENPLEPLSNWLHDYSSYWSDSNFIPMESKKFKFWNLN